MTDMHCRRAQLDIALLVGGDLDEAGQAGLRRHLEACPKCRCFLREMRFLMRLVDECPLRDEGDEASKQAVEDSLWPSLSTRLVTLSSRCDRFNGWIPAVAVAAVCLAMVLIASPPQMLGPQEASGYSSAGEVSWPASHSSLNSDASTTLPKWHNPPLSALPVGNSNRPSSPHPIEKMLGPNSAFPELNDPFELDLDQFDSSGPRIYMRNE